MPTYNIVDQGADKNGNTAIDPILGDLVGSNTTIVFPSGTYKLNGITIESGTNNLELIAPNGARLVPGVSSDNTRWFDVYSNGFVLDGFELDMRNTPIPPFVRMNSNSGNWELRRLITRGKVRAATDSNVGSNDSSDARTYFRLSSADGKRGLLQDCYFNEGACAADEASNRRAILVESGKGALTFNRCWFELWGENTIYAKKPEGKLKILNCFVRNTQNGLRLGGNTEVRNCVSIKDGQHPRSAWSGGSLQRGVSCEANVPADSADGINSYDGTLTIADCDFYHRYQSPSCGGPITGQVTCQRIVVDNTRISYDSTKNHDAIYTYDSQMSDGTPANLEYLEFNDVQVRNDHSSEYAIYIGQVPDEWGTVSGVLGGSGPQTNSTYISNRMTINGNPDEPNTTPPLPDPPALGTVPLQSAQLVRIDNTGNDSPTTYRITAGENALPAGNEGSTMTMSWGEDGGPSRPGNSSVATGSVPAGKIHSFYVTGGIVSTESSGPAVWTVDGEPYTPGSEVPLLTKTITSGKQESVEQWQQVTSAVQPSGVVVAKPLSYDGENPAHVRLRNVADGDFEYKLEEWEYLDGSHISETFHSLSAGTNEQVLQLDNGKSFKVKGGQAEVSDAKTTVSMGDFFGGTAPVVFAQPQTANGSDPVISRLSKITGNSFGVRLQEEEGQDGHVSETVGYIALQRRSGRIDGRVFEVRQADEEITEEWQRISFGNRYDSPLFYADIQTLNGGDTAELRYRNLTGNGVEVKIEEEESADTETSHVPETVGYAVFEGSV